jgi:hypothetical protein
MSPLAPMTYRTLARALLALLMVLALGVLAGCTVPSGASQSVPVSPAGIRVTGQVHAGPTCPVSQPGDSACADRSVSGAVLVVTTSAGAEVARATSAADGTFSLSIAPGDYILVPQPVSGLMGTAQPIPFHVAGGSAPAPLDVSYDTGIR